MLEDLKRLFAGNNFIGKMILINAGVFVVTNLITFIVMGRDNSWLMDYFAIPASITDLVFVPWTIVTYMFLHSGIPHILWNMLFLYWFGRIFQDMIGHQRLAGVYFLGGLAGAALYLLIYNVLYLSGESSFAGATMVGASAAVMAVMVATATRFPDYEVRLLILGTVKLKYLVLGLFVLSSLVDFTMNLGGNLAHIGGAAFGYFYIRNLDKGKDWAMDFYQFFDKLGKRFSTKNGPKMRVVHRKKPQTKRASSTARPASSKTSGNAQETQARLDAILDKISKAGYENLTKDEKAFLFKVSNKN